MDVQTTMPSATKAAPRALWVQVAPGLHVANNGASFVGTVTATAHGYEAVDGFGARRGVFVSLAEAKSALEEATGAPDPSGPFAPVL